MITTIKTLGTDIGLHDINKEKSYIDAKLKLEIRRAKAIEEAKNPKKSAPGAPRKP
jgi:hypothetical protein